MKETFKTYFTHPEEGEEEEAQNSPYAEYQELPGTVVQLVGTFTCTAWDYDYGDDGTTMDVVVGKPRVVLGRRNSEGTISIEPMKSKIMYTSKASTSLGLTMDATEYLKFFGNIPAGILGTCEATHYNENCGYETVEGCVYFNKSKKYTYIVINLNSNSDNYFMTQNVDENDDTEIGLESKLTVKFKVVTDEQNYPDPRN